MLNVKLYIKYGVKLFENVTKFDERTLLYRQIPRAKEGIGHRRVTNREFEAVRGHRDVDVEQHYESVHAELDCAEVRVNEPVVGEGGGGGEREGGR